ncbi:MAG: hypothetical protein Q9163_002374 [Psora crenata]
MTRPSTPPILLELRSASSLASQIKALRQLKNELIGHEQRKEMWVALGVLAPLVRILESHKGDSKRGLGDSDAYRNQDETTHLETEDEQARLQAIIIIGSLAHGGPPFLSPLHASLAVPPLLALLSPCQSSPQLILQTLRTLNNIADALVLSISNQSRTDASLPALLYTEGVLRSLNGLILQSSPSMVVHQQITLIAALISKTCQEENQRALLVQMGVLDGLAARLTSWIATTLMFSSNGEQKPSSTYELADGTIYLRNARLSSVLYAIGVIIQYSPSRAAHLLNTPCLTSIFQNFDNDIRPLCEEATASQPAGSKTTFKPPPSFVETLLPPLPTPPPRSALDHSMGFPPSDCIKVQSRQSQWPRCRSSAVELFTISGLEHVGEDESPLVPWLIYISRIFDEVTNLVAVRLLAILYSLRFVKKSRDSVIALLIVPPLVRMLDKDLRISQNALHPLDNSMPASASEIIKEEAPAVLAMLTVNNPKTQKAAADADAIKKLSQLLKESFDPVAINVPSAMWSSEPPKPTVAPSGNKTTRLGAPGVSPVAYHITRVRETTLVALAALASVKDEYRKAIIDNGVIPFVIRALKVENVHSTASPSSASPNDGDIEPIVIHGNSRESILAACGTARALSRSVSALRTSLLDAGLTAPLFVLLRWCDIEMKIAATAVICNLVVEVSPMREALLEGGILRLLCDHAHSDSVNLRLNAMWALKHLVVNANPRVKKDCLAELGAGWLRQIISNDPDMPSKSPVVDRDDGISTPIMMSTPNAAGEQVDLLNAVEDGSRQSSQAPEEDEDEDLKMSDSIGSLSKPENELKPRGASMKDRPSLEYSQRISLHQGSYLPDEIAVVKEGLEFIRNLMMGNDVDKMIDHIFHEIGQDEFLKILSAKLRPKVINAFSRDRKLPESNAVRHIQPQPEILKSACYILVHIAASGPKHRQLLVSQPKLLELIVPLFNHPDQEIRACCAWIVINLTWEQDASDKTACKGRARHLMSLGIYEKLEAMENDSDLNCKERSTEMKLDAAVVRSLSLDPAKTRVASHGGSGFTTTAKITTTLHDGSQKHFFLKTGEGRDAEVMFAGEHASLNALHTIPSLCPQSFAHGNLDSGGAFLVTDFLNMSSNHISASDEQGSGLSLAQKLAKLHTTPAPIPEGYDRPRFGFAVPTCCGDTVQENDFTESWADFYAQHRLLAILKKSERTNGKDEQLRSLVKMTAKEIVPRLIGDDHLNSGKGVTPVVVHGDLWSGNKGRGRIGGKGAVEDVVFDPSAAYAHGEYELGIMRMFGGFGESFMKEYHSICPKTEPVEEYEDRVNLYELYHHLNHYAIFGGGYKSGAFSIMRNLQRKYGSNK